MLDSIYHVSHLNYFQFAFWRENLEMLSLCILCCYDHPNITVLNNHFINFNAWHYHIPKCGIFK